MRILLLSPPEEGVKGGSVPSTYIRQNSSYLFPPLGLLYLASNLNRSKHQLKVIDSIASKLSIDDCAKRIKEYNPDVLGMTTLSYTLYPVRKIAEAAKRLLPNVRIVLGGPHINIYPYETMTFSEVDFCLLYFAESSFELLLQAIENNSGYENVPGLFYKRNQDICKSAQPVNNNINLDALKMPDRRFIDYTKYFTVANNKIVTTAISSRGCSYQCTFCDIFQKKVLTRSPENVIEEVKDIVKLNIKSIHFYDDNFNFDRERVIKICELMLKENLKIEWSFRGRVEPIDNDMAKLLYSAGCRRVHLGVESGGEETLKIIKKRISLEKVKHASAIYRKNKIKTLGYFIVGFPHESREDCVQTYKVASQLGLDYIFISILVPYPNTAIYRGLLQQGIKNHWLEFSKEPKMDYYIPNLHPHMSMEELQDIVADGHKRFYFSPAFIFKELFRTVRLRALIIKMKFALRLLLNKNQKFSKSID
jgi:radical SAM superfamily enzyme YgiQ (UPF0313 family)